MTETRESLPRPRIELEPLPRHGWNPTELVPVAEPSREMGTSGSCSAGRGCWRWDWPHSAPPISSLPSLPGAPDLDG